MTLQFGRPTPSGNISLLNAQRDLIARAYSGAQATADNELVDAGNALKGALKASGNSWRASLEAARTNAAEQEQDRIQTDAALLIQNAMKANQISGHYLGGDDKEYALPIDWLDHGWLCEALLINGVVRIGTNNLRDQNGFECPVYFRCDDWRAVLLSLESGPTSDKGQPPIIKKDRGKVPVVVKALAQMFPRERYPNGIPGPSEAPRKMIAKDLTDAIVALGKKLDPATLKAAIDRYNNSL